MVPEKSFRGTLPRTSSFGQEFAFMRVADRMRSVSMSREEAMEFLAPQWDEFVHKGVIELAAQQPGDFAPSRTKKRRRRKASRPSAGDVEAEEAYEIIAAMS
jgi:hypothetical protein